MTTEANDRGDRGAFGQIAQYQRELTRFVERNGGKIEKPADPNAFKSFLEEYMGREGQPRSITQGRHKKRVL